MAADFPVLTVHVHTLLLRAEAAGLDQAALLDGLTLDPGSKTLGVAPVPLSTFTTILDRCEAATADPLFAAHAALASTGEEYGLAYYAHVASADLRESIRNGMDLWDRMANPLRARFEEYAGGGRVVLTPVPGAPAAAQPYTEFLLGLLLVVSSKSACMVVVPEALQLAHAPRCSVADYEAAFGTAVAFGTDESAIAFSDASLNRPNPGADEQLVRLASADMLRQTQAYYTDGIDVVALIQATLSAAELSDDWRLETVAERHQVPVRTLQYRLQQAGTSFAALADSARRGRALRLLREGHPLGEVSFRLGYSDQTGLRKAFFRWFGTTPGNWRRRQAQQGSHSVADPP